MWALIAVLWEEESYKQGEFSPLLFKNQLPSQMLALRPVATVSVQPVALPYHSSVCDLMSLPEENRMVMTRKHLCCLAAVRAGVAAGCMLRDLKSRTQFSESYNRM